MSGTPEIPTADQLLAEFGFVRKLALSIVRDPHVADDIAQETLVVALEGATRPRGAPRAWLTGIVKNLARMRWRTGERRARRERAAARPESMPSAADNVVRLEAQERLVRAVRGLPEPTRTTVVLRYLEDLPLPAIAERMGVSVRAVESRLRRARAQLRDQLTEDYGDRKAWMAPLCLIAGVDPKAAVLGGGAGAAGVLIMGMKLKLALAVLLFVVVGVASVTTLWPGAAEPEAPAPLEVAEAPEVVDRPVETTEPAVVPPPSIEEPAAPIPEKPKTEASLDGILTDADGVPVPRGMISVTGKKGKARVAKRAWTDPAGRFRIPSIPAIPVRVVHHPLGVRPVESAVDLKPGENRVRLALLPAKVLDVTVVDASGRPFDGARLQLHDRTGTPVDRTAGRDGRARFVLTRGMRDLIVLAYPKDGREWVRVHVDEPPEAENLRVVLREADPIEGCVVDADGKPIPGVFIDFLEDGKKLEYVVSDDEGRFRIAAPRGGTLELVANGRCLRADKRGNIDLFATGRVAEVAAGTRDVVLKMKALPRNGRLTCELRGPNGIPMSGAKVSVRSALVLSKLAEGEADANGLVTFEDLPTGEVKLLAWDPLMTGQRRNWKGPKWSVVKVSGQTFVLKFREQVFITGTLFDPDGKPVKNCMILARNGEGESRGQVWTDEKGSFRIGTADDEPGPIRLMPKWRSPQGAEPNVIVDGVEPGTEDLVITLPR